MANGWIMGQLAAQNLYQPREDDPWADPMPWASDAASAQQGYNPDAGAAEAERWAAEQPYRGQPLDTGLRREPGDTSMLPAAQGFAALPGAVMGAIADVGRVPGDMMAKNPLPPTDELHGWFEDQRARKATDWAPEMAMNLAGSGTAFAMTKGAKNTAGMLGGRLGASRADPKLLQALDRAKDMEQSGRSQLDIWKDAGWQKFKDDQWRYEVPGGSGTLKPGSGKLADLWKHPQLWKAYPDMAEMPASVGKWNVDDFSSKLHPQTRAIYMPPQPGYEERIHVLKNSPKDQWKVSLQHEGTHGIQQREGFAKGSSPLSGDVLDIAREEREQLGHLLMDQYEKINDARSAWIKQTAADRGLKIGGDATSVDEHRAALKQLYDAWDVAHPGMEAKRKDLFNNAYAKQFQPPTLNDKVGVYSRFLGEAEARMVPERAKDSAASRKIVPPSWNLALQVPYDQQIVRFNNPTAAQMGSLMGTGR